MYFYKLDGVGHRSDNSTHLPNTHFFIRECWKKNKSIKKWGGGGFKTGRRSTFLNYFFHWLLVLTFNCN